jgi:hypothetical protein
MKVAQKARCTDIALDWTEERSRVWTLNRLSLLKRPPSAPAADQILWLEFDNLEVRFSTIDANAPTEAEKRFAKEITESR